VHRVLREGETFSADRSVWRVSCNVTVPVPLQVHPGLAFVQELPLCAGSVRCRAGHLCGAGGGGGQRAGSPVGVVGFLARVHIPERHARVSG
jgi:hypothetical protein